MTSKSIGHKQLISQSLSVLPTEEFSSTLLNYEYDKLSVDALMKIFNAAQLDHWESYEEMEERLRANSEFCESINLPSISGWAFLRFMRTYMYKSYNEFLRELNRTKRKTSHGRKKIPIPEEKETAFGEI